MVLSYRKENLGLSMDKEEFIRSRKFGLLYLYDEKGISIKHIPKIYTNDESTQSVVISAIGNSIDWEDSLNDSSYIELSNSISGDGGFLFGKVHYMRIFFWICASTISQVKKLLRDNPNLKSKINRIYKIYSTSNCECVIALLDLTNVKNYELGEQAESIDCAKLKVGSVNLIYDFLLSNFIIEYEDEFKYTNLEPKSQIYDESIYGDWIPFIKNDDFSRGQASPYFKFEKFYNLNHLTKGRVEEHHDDEDFSMWTTEEGSYCYFNFEIKNLDKLKTLLEIPKRIEEILDEDQIKHLKMTASSVFNDNLVYIYSNIFKQRITEDHVDATYQRRDSWGLDMYNVLGGDGYNNMYLGDGMSIDSRGNLIDD